MSGNSRAAVRSANAEGKVWLARRKLGRLSSVSAFASFRATNVPRMYVVDVSAPVTVLRRLLADERASGVRDPSRPFSDVALFRSVLDDVFSVLDANPESPRPAELARLAAQLALAGVTTADEESMPLLHLLATLLERQVEDLPPKHLGTVSWAFARMQATCLAPTLMPRLAAHAEKCLRDMHLQPLAQLAWGVAAHHSAVSRAGPSSRSSSEALTTVVPPPTPPTRLLSRIASMAVSQSTNPRDAVNMSQLVSALAGQGVQDPGGVYSALAAAAVGTIRPAVQPRTVCNIVMSFATLYENQPHTHFHLHARQRLHPGRDHYVEVPVGALTQDDMRPLFRAVELYCSQRLPDLLPADLAALMWSLAKSGCGDVALYDALAVACEPHFDTLHPVALSKVAWSLAAMTDSLDKNRVQVLTESIAAAAVERGLDESSPTLSAILAWSFAKTKTVLPDTFPAALVQQCTPHLDSMSLQAVCMLAHAIAQWTPGDEAQDDDSGSGAGAGAGGSGSDGSGVTPPTAVSPIGPVMTEAIDQVAARAATYFESVPSDAKLAGSSTLPPEALTTLLWAVARVGHASPSVEAVTGAIAATAGRDLYRFDPGQLSFTAWSLSKSPVPSDATRALLATVLAECLNRDTSSFLPQSLALLAWTCVREHLAAPEDDTKTKLLGRLAVEAGRQVGDFAPSHLAMLTLAYGRYVGTVSDLPLECMERDLMSRVSVAAISALPDFSDVDLARLAWGVSLAHLVPSSDVFTTAVLAERESRGDEFSPTAVPLFDRALDKLS